jgi:tRNA uridine 5-carboxymethylaminomethyl modification enzyme
MLTARAEHRLALRADNALSRLGEIADRLGLLDEGAAAALKSYRDRKQAAANALATEVVGTELGLAETAKRSRGDWARRDDVYPLVADEMGSDPAALEALHDALYAPYLDREAEDLARRSRDGSLVIAADFDFSGVPGLSSEMQGRLAAARPSNLGQAERIRGVTPAALAALHFALKARA